MSTVVSLLPCPFCGGTCDFGGWLGADRGIRGPKCNECGSTTPNIKTWQTRQVVEAQPEFCDPSFSTYDIASKIMSDCGCSTDNQRLLDRVAARIDKYFSIMCKD